MLLFIVVDLEYHHTNELVGGVGVQQVKKSYLSSQRSLGLMKSFIFLASFLVLGCIEASSLNCAIDDSNKIDCGYAGIDENGCVSKGCCWVPAGQNSQTPWCFNGGSGSNSYALSSMKETSNGYVGTLNKVGDTSSATIAQLSLEITFETVDFVRVKMTDAKNARWEVPESVIPRTKNIATYGNTGTTTNTVKNYKVSYTESPFSFEVLRVSDGASIFKLDPDSFVFEDQYISFTTIGDSSATTYGIGESTRLSQALKSGTYTLWAADIPALVFDVNLYGSYPYYLQMVGGNAHGAMLMNSNGMDITLQQGLINFKVIGGIIDLYVFTGPTPAAVVDQYTQVVGRPMMTPYWALGFHNCKYGYTSVQQVEDVVANYIAAGIPLDTQWMDIDYMQNYKDFTFDAMNFPQAEVASFVDGLHKGGMHFVPIIDPGIMVQQGYDAYDQGVKQDLFVKDITGDYYLGQVWPGPVHFPDFLHPSTQAYWTNQIQSVHDAVEIDGLWIDMNEVSNFCNNDGGGQVCVNSHSAGCPAAGASQTDCCLVCYTVDPSNSLDFPPYAIHNHQQNGKLSTKTMAMSATHYGNITEYDVHNIYGLTEQIATNAALAEVRGKRPFILTRSSFMSSGAHTAKWTGDNAATWSDLQSSIISIMDFSLFGVPMVGADICGFIYDTTAELCTRWIEVGAFYPFSRNHNTLGAAPQELYLWDSVTQAAKTALGMRYQLLPYMYTLFYHASTSGTTVTRPLWFNFPSDSGSQGIDRQFMLGDAILVSPVLDQGATSVNAYFPPKAMWYSFQDWSMASSVDTSFSEQGVTLSLYTPLTATNVHVKGGNILPLQQAAMTTTAGRLTPFTLLVALCPGGKAFGSLFWDNGEQVDFTEYYLSQSYSAQFAGDAGSVTGIVQHNTYSASSEVAMDTVVVLGKGLSQPSSASLNGKALSMSQIVFDTEKGSIAFSGLGLAVSDAIDLTWGKV
jgi:alpha-D-xyloside xylohydrolase